MRCLALPLHSGGVAQSRAPRAQRERLLVAAARRVRQPVGPKRKPPPLAGLPQPPLNDRSACVARVVVWGSICHSSRGRGHQAWLTRDRIRPLSVRWHPVVQHAVWARRYPDRPLPRYRSIPRSRKKAYCAFSRRRNHRARPQRDAEPGKIVHDARRRDGVSARRCRSRVTTAASMRHRYSCCWSANTSNAPEISIRFGSYGRTSSCSPIGSERPTPSASSKMRSAANVFSKFSSGSP